MPRFLRGRRGHALRAEAVHRRRGARVRPRRGRNARAGGADRDLLGRRAGAAGRRRLDGADRGAEAVCAAVGRRRVPGRGEVVLSQPVAGLARLARIAAAGRPRRIDRHDATAGRLRHAEGRRRRPALGRQRQHGRHVPVHGGRPVRSHAFQGRASGQIVGDAGGGAGHGPQRPHAARRKLLAVDDANGGRSGLPGGRRQHQPGARGRAGEHPATARTAAGCRRRRPAEGAGLPLAAGGIATEGPGKGRIDGRVTRKSAGRGRQARRLGRGRLGGRR